MDPGNYTTRWDINESLVLLTSHTVLQELLIVGCDLIHVDPMTNESAETVLRLMLGNEGLSSAPNAIDRLISICDGLPLALRACGAFLLSHPEITIEQFVHRCSDSDHLSRVVGISRGGTVAAAFDLIVSDLGEAEKHAYHVFGCLRRAELPLGAIAAAMHWSAPEVRQSLECLVERNLLESVATDRYRIHSVVLLHAEALATEDSPPVERHEILHRMIRWYQRIAHDADIAIIPDRLRISQQHGDTDESAPLPAFDSPRDAFAWFEQERASLLECVVGAYENGWFVASWGLCESLWLFYLNYKYFADWIESHRAGIASARALGDTVAEARLCQQLARAYIELDDYEEAERLLNLALSRAVESGHRHLEGSIYEFMGTLDIRRGSFEAAISSLRRSKAIYDGLDSVRAVALQCYHLGLAFLGDGQVAMAIVELEYALSLIDDERDQVTRTHLLIELGRAYTLSGNVDDGVKVLQGAIDSASSLRLWHDEVRARQFLADLWLQIGERRRANEEIRQAGEMADALGIGTPSQ